MSRSIKTKLAMLGVVAGLTAVSGASFASSAQARRPRPSDGEHAPAFEQVGEHSDADAPAQLAGHRRRTPSSCGRRRSIRTSSSSPFKSNDLEVHGSHRPHARSAAGCTRKFDAVKGRGFRYPIDSIYKMTRDRHASWSAALELERTTAPERRPELGDARRAQAGKTQCEFWSSRTTRTSPPSFAADCLKQAATSTTPPTARTACSSPRREAYDALVVDRMLPGVDGLTVIRTLRASANTTPVLILSALGEVDDRVKGLKAGGDDYLVKPFAFSELLARLEALARRAKTGGERRRRCSKSPTSRWTYCAAKCGAAANRSTCSRASSNCSSSCCATPGASRDAHDAAREACGIITSIRRPTSSTCTSAGCARRSTKASTARCCTRSAAPATASTADARLPCSCRASFAPAYSASRSPTWRCSPSPSARCPRSSTGRRSAISIRRRTRSSRRRSTASYETYERSGLRGLGDVINERVERDGEDRPTTCSRMRSASASRATCRHGRAASTTRRANGSISCSPTARPPCARCCCPSAWASACSSAATSASSRRFAKCCAARRSTASR